MANGPGGHGAHASHDVGLVGDGATAVAPSNGQGGFKANQRATFGIATAVANTRKHDGCGGLRE